MQKRLTLHEKAVLAMKKAVKQVVAQHKKDGRSLVVFENGRIKRIQAKYLKK